MTHEEGEGVSHRGAGSPPIETQKALKGMDYPAGKQAILEKARENNAPQEIMQILEDIPEREYENAADVSKEFKGETGHVEEMGRTEGRGGREEGEGISHRGAGSPPIEAQKALKGMDYPAGKQEIIEKARENNAPQEVMQILEDLPEREFQNAADVSKEFSGETGHIEESGGREEKRGRKER
jgi:hypothetical protein